MTFCRTEGRKYYLSLASFSRGFWSKIRPVGALSSDERRKNMTSATYQYHLSYQYHGHHLGNATNFLSCRIHRSNWSWAWPRWLTGGCRCRERRQRRHHPPRRWFWGMQICPLICIVVNLKMPTRRNIWGIARGCFWGVDGAATWRHWAG